MTSIKKFELFIKRQHWIFASTYKDVSPHWYIIKNVLSTQDKAIFEEFVLFIRHHGYVQRFKGRDYICFNIGKHKYWTMGNPVPETYIINRATIVSAKNNIPVDKLKDGE